MRVCLDLSVLRARPTGVGYYGYFLGRALTENFVQAEQYLAFDGLRFSELKQYIDSFARRSTIKTNLSQSLWNATASIPIMRSAWRRLKATAFSRGVADYDLVHAIAYAPPVRTARSWVPLIHDLSHLRFPQFHPSERVRWLEKLDAVIGEAILVNTVSEFSKREIVTMLGVEAERIRVTHPGVNFAFAEPQLQADAAVLSRYGLKAGRFLLSVATIDPRKNLGVLVEAFAQLPQSIRSDAVLVVVGQPGWRTVDFPKTTARLQERAEIRFLGYVPTDHLRSLYHNTALFLYSSYYEGFGIPVAEAHLAGAPVAISKGTGLEEAACGLAQEIVVDDINGWSLAMRRAIDDQGWRGQPARRMRSAAAKAFNWRRNAELTQGIYDDVARHLASQHRGRAYGEPREQQDRYA